MKITKMHGLGNDFIVFFDDGTVQFDVTDMAQRLCDRHTGIGADGLVIVMPSKVADVRMRIINSDGSDTEVFTVETLAGIMTPTIIAENGVAKLVKVNMGKPTFSAKDIPMDIESDKVIDYTIDVDGTSYVVSSVLLGVPHTEVFVEDVTAVPLTVLGPKIEKHPLFPKGTNVNFIQVVDEKTVKVRTWERGAGATLACGTGSCSSAVMAHEKGLTSRSVDVELYLGVLHVDYDEDGTVYMTGPATEVFSLELEDVTC